MSQIAGEKCVNCNTPLLLEKEGRFCTHCQSVCCNDCYAKISQCPSCQEKISSKPIPSAATIQAIEKTPIEPPNEPHLTMYGGTITESEYQRAIRHNKLAWTFMIAAGIPSLLIIAVIAAFTFRKLLYIAPAILAPLHPIAYRIFPGAKKHGTGLFRKYEGRRSVIIAKYNQNEASGN